MSKPAQPNNKRQRKDAWPSTDQSKKKWPSGGLLEGLDDAVWCALGHISPREFERDNPQQPQIRQALDLIGMGWVATNTTPYRVAIGGKSGKFKAAQKKHKANNWEPQRPFPSYPL